MQEDSSITAPRLLRTSQIDEIALMCAREAILLTLANSTGFTIHMTCLRDETNDTVTVTERQSIASGHCFP